MVALMQLTIDNALSLTERQNLAHYEAIVERGLATFVEVGNALAIIRDKRLYRESYHTFEEYCRERWGLSRIHAHRMIGAARVTENLLPIGNILQEGSTNNHFPLPITESQARPLARLEPEQQREAWREAVETAPGGKVTAAHVEQVVARIKPGAKMIELGEITDDEVLRIARDGGRQLCDHALQKWIGNAYNMDEATRQAYIKRWKEIRSRIGKTGNESSIGVHYSSQTPEWYTPSLIIERILKAMGQIDLDPCSNSHETPNVPATRHYTKYDDGLSQKWSGRVYMNPPYGRDISKWVNYLCKEYEQGDVSEAIALLPARTDTEWFRKLRQYSRCFIWGRLRFSDNETGAPFPSMVVYFGGNVDKFKGAFGDIGDIYVWSPIGRETSN